MDLDVWLIFWLGHHLPVYSDLGELFLWHGNGTSPKQHSN